MTDLIVDANSVYARAWYASKEDPSQTVIAALNVAMMLFNPERLGEHVSRSLFCWDGGQKKDKQRAARPAEYETTKAVVSDGVEFLFGTPNIRKEGYEADDLIATAALHSQAEHVIIASADKDLHQLNSERISVFDINARGLVSRREIISKWHVKRPSQVAIALAIQGDSADKIPGIRGWGPKKVEKLFEAVTPEMEFDAALQAVMAQIPADRLPEFMEALGITLLDPDVPGVPEPAPVILVEPCHLEPSGLGRLMSYYLGLYRQYGHSTLGARDREE
jgi:5'-3' exonuclease